MPSVLPVVRQQLLQLGWPLIHACAFGAGGNRFFLLIYSWSKAAQRRGHRI